MAPVYTTNTEHVALPDGGFSLLVPVAAEVQRVYYAAKAVDDNTPFPFWAKLWPAAIGLATFLEQQPGHVQGKQVLELAAGLGLPSLVAARVATNVCLSDYLPEAVHLAMASAALHQLPNVTGRVLNWHQLPEELNTDVLLMSDVNYDPGEFDQLYKVFDLFINKGATIVLSTPQRLMAKPLIDRLLPWCTQQESIEIAQHGVVTMVSVLVLRATC